MKKTNKIYGLLFRPGSSTQEGYENIINSSDYSVKSNFMGEYRNHIAGMEIVAESAKIFVLNNYKKVIDWTNLNVIINDNSKQSTEYFNYEAKVEKKERRKEEKIISRSGKLIKHVRTIKSPILDEIMDRIEAEDKLRHNPIKTLTDVVLDTTDGDFSLVINDKHHLWIDNSSIIIIAEYIENQLKGTAL